MADVVYVHVGAPKTGTTYLQDRLLANRHRLAEHGVGYPAGASGDMFDAALDLIDRRWGGHRELVRGEWDALAERVRRTPGTAVVSHEVLAAARPDQVKRAIRDLEGEVHVVYSARDIARQVPAEWQESVKHRYRRSFDRFLRSVQAVERHDSPMWFWQVQGLPDVLDRWAADLPPEHVHLVTVPRSGAAPGRLWRRYCRAFGIDPRWATEGGAARSNASLGIDETALLRELNGRLKKAGLDSGSYRTLVRHVVVHQTLSSRKRMRPVSLPPKAYGWAEEVAEEWIEYVEQASIDVVGNLDDLRPVHRDAEDWQDPDRAKPRRVADAALDSLVAVILEAAAHEDEAPHETSVSCTRRGRAPGACAPAAVAISNRVVVHAAVDSSVLFVMSCSRLPGVIA